MTLYRIAPTGTPHRFHPCPLDSLDGRSNKLQYITTATVVTTVVNIQQQYVEETPASSKHRNKRRKKNIIWG